MADEEGIESTEEPIIQEEEPEEEPEGEPEAQERVDPIRSLDLIMDIPLRVAVELGRTRMMVNDLLQLAQGSVIELVKNAGDPLEVLINDKPVARGEVVVLNDKFGVRITEIITPTERVEKLK
jgi:flagellar motor switch protein FliN/FliY